MVDELIEDHRGVQKDNSQRFLRPNGVVESLIGLRADPIDVDSAAFSEFRMVGRIPGPSGKLWGVTLFVAPDIALKNVDRAGGRARGPILPVF